MANSTLETIIVVLPLLQQPAFCLDSCGQLHCNRAAQVLAPADGSLLEAWLGDSLGLWQAWDRSAGLELTVSLGSGLYAVTAQPLADGTLFLLQELDTPPEAQAALAVASQVLRQPLHDLNAHLQLLSRQLERQEDPALLEQMSRINRQIYRLTRLAGNLADLQALACGQYHVRKELVELRSWLRERLEEAEDLCRAAGRELLVVPLDQAVTVQADPALLERALYNLLSNALKFGVPTEPIEVRAELTNTTLLLRVRSRCRDGGQELLRAAFTRLEQRDLLPDPRWGVGLGLPLVLMIARLHGGTAAVECDSADLATVTMSLPRCRPLQKPLLEAPPPFEYAGGMRRSLVELSDCLPNEVYHPDAI